MLVSDDKQLFLSDCWDLQKQRKMENKRYLSFPASALAYQALHKVLHGECISDSVSYYKLVSKKNLLDH